MNVTEFKQHLLAHADLALAFALPDGGFVPAHFHITEVGHVEKNFIDCGGTVRSGGSSTGLLSVTLSVQQLDTACAAALRAVSR